MTTLAADLVRNQSLGDTGEFSVIASDIIYLGAAVGLVDASGHARPLVGGDVFAGFAQERCDNSAGAAAAKRIRTNLKGSVELSVSGAVITDVGQPVYAQDDNAYSFNPVSGTFIGFVERFVSSGVVVVRYDAFGFKDPWGAYSKRETLAATKTFDAEDNGKLFCVTAAGDADVLTFPAIAAGLSDIVILAVDAFGTTAVTLDLDASDLWLGPDIAAASGDGKQLVLTKATQRRGDFITVNGPEADGYMVRLHGTWAREA